jgi:hypothetical protein
MRHNVVGDKTLILDSEFRGQESETEEKSKEERAKSKRQGPPVKFVPPLLNTPCCHCHEFNLAGSFSSKNLTGPR